MTRVKTQASGTSFDAINCFVAQAVAQMGDAWTLIILRDAFNGVTRFDQFKAELEIATNVLADRLQRLTRAGILERRSSVVDRRRVDYRLTGKGRALHPVLIALAQWGECWQPHPRGARVVFVERSTGKPIAPVHVRAAGGRMLGPHEVTPVPGPAADARMKSLLGYRARGGTGLMGKAARPRMSSR